MNDKQIIGLVKKAMTACRGERFSICQCMMKQGEDLWFSDERTVLKLPARVFPNCEDGGYPADAVKALCNGLNVKPAYPVGDFPALPVHQEATTETTDEFWDDVRGVSTACSTDETRFVLMTPGYDKGDLVATDGRRLHLVKGKDTLNLKGVPWEKKKHSAALMAYPGKLWNLWLSVAKGGEYSEKDGVRNFGLYEVSCFTKPQEGCYPNYHQVIPQMAGLVPVSLPIEEMTKYEKMAGKKAESTVTLRKGKVILRGSGFPEVEAGTCDEKVDFILLIRYALEAAMFVGTDEILYQDGCAPCVFMKGKRTAVLMPRRDF